MPNHYKETVMNNKQQRLIGYVGADPQIKVLENGIKRVGFPLRTHQILRPGGPVRLAAVVWHEVVAWGPLAAKVQSALSVGSHILVSGRLAHRCLPEKDPKAGSLPQINADKIITLDRTW